MSTPSAKAEFILTMGFLWTHTPASSTGPPEGLQGNGRSPLGEHLGQTEKMQTQAKWYETHQKNDPILFLTSI